MQRDDQRLRAFQGLRWLEGEVRELVDMARFQSAADQRLFKTQFARIRERISDFEKDLIDLLICYPEARDTLPLSRLLDERTASKQTAPRRLARLRAELAELNSVLKAAPTDQQFALRKRIAAKERAIRAAGG